MCVEGSQAIVQLRGALKRGFLAKKGHLKRLRPPATACDSGHPHGGEEWLHIPLLYVSPESGAEQ